MRVRSKKSYTNLEEYDSKSVLYTEESFHQGITFNAKFIGACEVPRPSSRVEIVAAMRRIRYEYKCKAVKKRKITLTVSTEGVRVALREKGKTPSSLTLMHYPIYRIFYVSHDSLDMNIFSFISREGQVFKCCVFKTTKKAQATRVVRAIGQAFEVCHKISVAANKSVNGHIASGNETETVTVAGDVTPPAPSTPSTPMTSVNTNITSKENHNQLNGGSHKPPSSTAGSHPPSTQGTITGGDDRSAQINLMTLEPNTNLSSQFSSSLKIIEDKLEMLTSRIVKMEESQDKLISLLLNEKWSSGPSLNVLNGLNTFRMIPNSYTFPPPTTNVDASMGQVFSGHPMNGHHQQAMIPTDTSYLSLCLQDAQSPGSIRNHQHLQHLQQLFSSQNGSVSASDSGISPGSAGSATNLIQSLFNPVQSNSPAGSIRPPNTLSMMSPGKDSVFSSGASSMTSSPPSLTGGGGNNIQSSHSLFNPSSTTSSQHHNLAATTSEAAAVIPSSNASIFPDMNMSSNSQSKSSTTVLTSAMKEPSGGGGLVTTVPGGRIGLTLNVNTTSFDPITKNTEARMNGSEKKITGTTKNGSSNDLRRRENGNRKQNNWSNSTQNGNSNSITLVNGYKKDEGAATINQSFISDLLSS